MFHSIFFQIAYFSYIYNHLFAHKKKQIKSDYFENLFIAQLTVVVE